MIQRTFPCATLVCLAVLLGACASTEEAATPEAGENRGLETTETPDAVPSDEPVVLDEGVPVDDDEWQRMIDDAAALRASMRYEDALAAVRQAVALDPPEPFHHRLRGLEFRIKEHLLHETMIDAFVRFDREHYVIGDVLEGEIVLMNVSSQTLVIPASKLMRAMGQEEESESNTTFRWTMTYREFVPSNTLITNKDVKNVSVDEDIVLRRGESHRIPIAVETMRTNPGGTMLRTYSLAASLHAPEVRIGEEEFHGEVDFRPATVRVYPRNAKHLSEAPMDKVRLAWDKQAATHLTLAASFVEGDREREDLIEWVGLRLADGATSDRMADALMTCLLILSGEEATKTRDDWLTWLKTREK